MIENNTRDMTEIPQKDFGGRVKNKEDGYSQSRRRWQYNRPLITGVIVAVSIAVLAVVLLLANRFDKDSGVAANGTESNGIAGTTSTIRIEIPFFAQEQYLVGTGVIAYMESDLSENVSTVLGEYRSSQRMDVGYPVTLKFDITGMPAGYQVAGLRVEVSENTAFDAPRVIPLSVEDRSVSIYHLKTGMQYYFRIIVTVSDGSEVFAQGTFKTAATPRILSIEGIANARDFGGWKTTSGKTVRQGVLYRGSEMDANVEDYFQITEAGKDVMLNVLGVKTELDLRWNVPTDALGEKAEHRRYATVMYLELFEEENREKVRVLFSDLADPNVYPAYIHCTYGLDRTGTICTLLGLLLGMREEDVIRAHELSALYIGGANTESLEEFIAELNKWEGETLMEKVESYLFSVGVTQAEIDSIREIFLTD